MKVWDCTAGCYEQVVPERRRQSDVEGQYVDTLFLPFLSKADQNANPMLKQLREVHRCRTRSDGFGVYAWSAMIAFRDAVNAQVKANGGVNGVTRKTIFAELNKIHQFNADGMFGTIDLAGRKTSPCHVLLQVKSGDFQRSSRRRRVRSTAPRRTWSRSSSTCTDLTEIGSPAASVPAVAARALVP